MKNTGQADRGICILIYSRKRRGSPAKTQSPPQLQQGTILARGCCGCVKVFPNHTSSAEADVGWTKSAEVIEPPLPAALLLRGARGACGLAERCR